MDISTLPFALIGSFVSVVISLLLEYRTSFFKRAGQRKREETTRAVAQAQVDMAKQVLSSLPEKTLDRYLNYLVYSQRGDGSFPQPFYIVSPSLDSAEVEKLIETKQATLQQRLEGIEKRFPKEATLEKIASINDAILATNLESIVETVKRLEDKMLTKWDVVQIVFQVFAATGAAVTMVFVIVNFVLTHIKL